MAGNVKFEVSSASPDDSGFSGGYPSGQRGSYSGPSLDRSGSFREGTDSRSFSSGAAVGTSKLHSAVVADLPPLSQCLILEPITMGDSKYTRAGELRRALGVLTFGNASEDNSFAAAQARPPPTLSTDEVKRFRATVEDGSQKARYRGKRLDESLVKLNKYFESINSKKQQTNDRSSGPGVLKMGTQSHRSSSDLTAQKIVDRSNNMGLNKRSRTPIGDMRAEGRVNGVPRQHLVLGRDKDAAKEGSSDLGEEKIRRLPAGGEGWYKKMKRKRSVSSVCPKPLDGDGDLKRTMHARLGNDSGNDSSDAHGFRPGSSNGANGSSKLDGPPSSVSYSGRMASKNEWEKASLSRELIGMNKERLLQKGNTKLNIREDPHLFSSSSITKGKASRGQRSGPSSVGNSSPSFSRMSGTPEDWEQPSNVSKVHSLAGVNDRKRPLPADSSSPPITQWVGQRPQKISRNRRTNIVSPASNHDEVQISAKGCAPPDFSTRVPGGVNGSLPVRNIMSSSQQLKAKLESAQSPARLSESEVNSIVENRSKDKGLGGLDVDEKGANGHQQHASPSGLITKKAKLLAKDEVGDGVRRQGRSGRGSSIPKGSISPLREKLENPAIGKPIRNSRPGSEKNGSKTGRPPLKKHSERKGFTRLGPVPNSCSPDFTGDSDDDREELLSAAQFACSASYNGCSSSFWKKMEPLFRVRAEDIIFLEEQLKVVEDCLSGLTQVAVLDQDHVSQIQQCWPQSFVSGESKMCLPENGLMVQAKTMNHLGQCQDHDSLQKSLDSQTGLNKLTPLYQRLISALIAEDGVEDYEGNHFVSTAAALSHTDDYCTSDRIFCNGNASHNRFSSIQLSLHEEFEEGGYSFIHSVDRPGPESYENDTNGALAISIRASGSTSLECGYDGVNMDNKLLLELQSIDIYPDTVPDLAEGDDELIKEDISLLKKQLSQKSRKKKAYLEGLQTALDEKKEAEQRGLEQVAMNRLTELALRKLLATRGNYALRIGISKVSRHVALAFVKRTLARCQKFEVGGKSCFSEPFLRDVLLAVPSNNAATADSSQAEQRLETRTSGAYPVGSEQLDSQNDKSERSPCDAYESLSQSDHAFAKNGPITNRGKKKEVLLDDVGGNTSLRSTSALGSSLLGGVKGKRSERDSGAKAGRPLSNSKGERKTKSKPKQKAAQLSTHPVQPAVFGELVANASYRKREGLISPGNILNSSNESNDAMDLSSLPLSELDSIEDLNVANEFEGHQDLSTWLNFDEVDGLQEDDGIGGLQIPMDDLSDLNMLL